jgi:hypothetical protein
MNRQKRGNAIIPALGQDPLRPVDTEIKTAEHGMFVAFDIDAE